MEPTPRTLGEYETETGKSPFSEWLEGLKDLQARATIRKRLNRVRLGNLGNTKDIGKGIKELKIDFGPGYRVYFGEDGPLLVVLLCAGDKGSQNLDIKKAQEYWADYWR